MVFRTRADALDAPVSASDAVKDAVGTMVRQFADPLAFYRELVQNSIDAGASQIDVRLRYDRDDDSVVIAVHDDGVGMNLETIERCLLVLFRSSKDKDPSKIGKFGVGFFSVFAIAPKAVRVDTGTGSDGFRVELRGDFTYEVTESSPRKGTTVTLVLAMKQSEARSFVERSVAALERWCPHVEIPLHVLSTVRGGEIDKRIDHPFAIEGAPSVLVQSAVGSIALTIANDGRAAFYKRGILLYDCPNTFFSGVSFKVEARALVHTVSRDNVKRDGAFAAVIAAVESAIKSELAVTAHTVASAALREAIALEPGDPRTHDAQQRAARSLRALSALSSYIALDVPAPLCDPDPSTSERIHRGSPRQIRYFAAQPDMLTRALSRKKQPVLWTHALGESHADLLRAMLEDNAIDVRARFCAVAPMDGALEPTEEDLLDRTRRLLHAVGVPLVRAVEISGVCSDALFLALNASEFANAPRAGMVLDAADTDTKLFTLFSTRAAALNRSHPAWREAVLSAELDPSFAALVIARLVLLDAGKLDAGRDRTLFEALPALERGVR